MNKTKQALATMISSFEWFSSESAAVYYTFLNDLPDDVTAQAIKELIKTSDKAPSIAMIRRKAEALIDTAKGVKKVNSSERWTEYLKAVKHRKGWGIQPHFKDKAMEIAAASVPADEIGRATNDKLPILRSQFIKAYEEAEKNQIEEESNTKAIQSVKKQTQKLTSGFYGALP